MGSPAGGSEVDSHLVGGPPEWARRRGSNREAEESSYGKEVRIVGSEWLWQAHGFKGRAFKHCPEGEPRVQPAGVGHSGMAVLVGQRAMAWVNDRRGPTTLLRSKSESPRVRRVLANAARSSSRVSGARKSSHRCPGERRNSAMPRFSYQSAEMLAAGAGAVPAASCQG